MFRWSWMRSRTRTTWGWFDTDAFRFPPAAAAAIVRANSAAPAAFCLPSPCMIMPAPAPAPAFFVPWKSATTAVGTTQYGTYRSVTAPSSDRSATLRRKIPLFSHFPPDSMAVSFVILLLSMKCFWKTSAAPPEPIVVTAPQYSHTTSASPAEGFIGPPHELHLKFCGIGGGAAAWTGAPGL